MTKNIFKIALFTVITVLFASCGMKDCKCYAKYVVNQNDTIIKIDYDTVSNHTRGECTEFNKDEVQNLDSIRYVHHTLFCEEE